MKDEDDEVSAAEQATADAVGSAASSTSQAGISAGVASGAATGDFGAAWNMLNSLTLIAFIPMMSTNLPLALS